MMKFHSALVLLAATFMGSTIADNTGKSAPSSALCDMFKTLCSSPLFQMIVCSPLPQMAEGLLTRLQSITTIIITSRSRETHSPIKPECESMEQSAWKTAITT